MAKYPINVTSPHQKKHSRWLAFFTFPISLKPIMLIPHIIILFFLGIAMFFAAIIGIIGIIINGQYPKDLQKFVVGVLRWEFRVKAYYLCLTDEYPPFDLEQK